MSLGDVLYYILKPFVKLFFITKLNLKLEVNELKFYDESVFLIGPHYTVEDPILAMMYGKKMIRFLGSDANLEVGWKNVVFKLFHIVSFARKRTDVRAIRTMKNAVDAGFSVGLYPEGGRNWDGVTEPLIPATAKLAKLLNIPVYAMMTKGLHISNPRWATKHRRGRVYVQVKEIISATEIKQMKSDEVLAVMTRALSHDDYKWQKQARIPFKGNTRAEHIQRLLFRCSECSAMDSFDSQNNDFWCKECNAKYNIDEFGLITGNSKFDNVANWNKWQQQFIGKNADFVFHEKAISMEIVTKTDMSKVTADLIMDKSGIQIFNLDDDIKVDTPFNTIESIAAIYRDSLEFYSHDIKYRFKFLPKEHTSFVLFLETLYSFTEKA